MYNYDDETITTTEKRKRKELIEKFNNFNYKNMFKGEIMKKK